MTTVKIVCPNCKGAGGITTRTSYGALLESCGTCGGQCWMEATPWNSAHEKEKRRQKAKVDKAIAAAKRPLPLNWVKTTAGTYAMKGRWGNMALVCPSGSTKDWGIQYRRGAGDWTFHRVSAPSGSRLFRTRDPFRAMEVARGLVEAEWDSEELRTPEQDLDELVAKHEAHFRKLRHPSRAYQNNRSYSLYTYAVWMKNNRPNELARVVSLLRTNLPPTEEPTPFSEG